MWRRERENLSANSAEASDVRRLTKSHNLLAKYKALFAGNRNGQLSSSRFPQTYCLLCFCSNFILLVYAQQQQQKLLCFLLWSFPYRRAMSSCSTLCSCFVGEPNTTSELVSVGFFFYSWSKLLLEKLKKTWRASITFSSRSFQLIYCVFVCVCLLACQRKTAYKAARYIVSFVLSSKRSNNNKKSDCD